MKELEPFLARELRGEDAYFTIDRTTEDLDAFMAREASRCRAIADDLGAGAQNVYLVGAGGSMANLQPLKAIFDRLLRIPVEVYTGYSLIGQRPSQLGPTSLVFFASNSGEVEDSVAALRFAKERGARTVAVVTYPDSTLGRECDACIEFGRGDEVTMVGPLLVALRLAEQGGNAALAAELFEGVAALPGVLARATALELERAEERAREFLDSTHLYLLGSGVLAGLAYKLAFNIVMENVRIGATYLDAAEHRHGPCEALERERPDMLFLVGTDWSREQTLRTLEACRRGGARTLVYDTADYDGVHPLLAPVVLYPAVQPFIVYSAVLRGIVDLTPRVMMGKRGAYAFEQSAE
jgi:fructoselysine-6-phosphate deglycase